MDCWAGGTQDGEDSTGRTLRPKEEAAHSTKGAQRGKGQAPRGPTWYVVWDAVSRIWGFILRARVGCSKVGSEGPDLSFRKTFWPLCRKGMEGAKTEIQKELLQSSREVGSGGRRKATFQGFLGKTGATGLPDGLDKTGRCP